MSETSKPSLRVLLVDDHRDNAFSFGLVLKTWGHQVWTAYDGVEALGKFNECQPHIVLLDIRLPKMNGLEVCREIRRLSGSEPIVVAITGCATSEERQLATEAGFTEVFIKPVDLTGFQSYLDMVRTLPVAPQDSTAG